MKTIFTTIFVMGLYMGLQAQTPDSSSNPSTQSITWPSSSFQVLDINNVSAPIMPHAEIFWHRDFTNKHYEVPKNSGLYSIHNGAFWIGAKDSTGQVYTSAATYNQKGSDFIYGVLQPNGTLDTAQNNSYQLYNPVKLNKWEIDLARQDPSTYTHTAKWPGAHPFFPGQLAPFLDANGNGVYDPIAGDYPLIKGDQAIFHTFNDRVFHGETMSASLGIEVHSLSYAYTCQDIQDTDPDAVINHTTFHELTIINRSSRNYREVHLGQFLDVDLGNYADDRVGCDTVLNAAFVYNGNNTDSDYGKNAPTQAIVFLEQPMTSMVAYQNDNSTIGNPIYSGHYYNYLSGKLKDGSSIKHPDGYDTKRMFTGEPYSNGAYNDDKNGDKRLLAATGPYDLKAGDTLKLKYALVYSRDADHANGLNTSIDKMARDITKIKYWYASGAFPNCQKPSAINDLKNHSPQIYPNPSSGKFQVELPENKTVISGDIYSANGQLLQQVLLKSGLNTIDLEALPAGIYFLKLNHDGRYSTHKLVVTH